LFQGRSIPRSDDEDSIKNRTYSVFYYKEGKESRKKENSREIDRGSTVRRALSSSGQAPEDPLFQRPPHTTLPQLGEDFPGSREGYDSHYQDHNSSLLMENVVPISSKFSEGPVERQHQHMTPPYQYFHFADTPSLQDVSPDDTLILEYQKKTTMGNHQSRHVPKDATMNVQVRIEFMFPYFTTRRERNQGRMRQQERLIVDQPSDGPRHYRLFIKTTMGNHQSRHVPKDHL
jgi:hypothetical protein